MDQSNQSSLQNNWKIPAWNYGDFTFGAKLSSGDTFYSGSINWTLKNRIRLTNPIRKLNTNSKDDPKLTLITKIRLVGKNNHTHYGQQTCIYTPCRALHRTPCANPNNQPRICLIDEFKDRDSCCSIYLQTPQSTVNGPPCGGHLPMVVLCCNTTNVESSFHYNYQISRTSR